MSVNTLTTVRSGKKKSALKIGALCDLPQDFIRYCGDNEVAIIPNIKIMIPEKFQDNSAIRKYKELKRSGSSVRKMMRSTEDFQHLLTFEIPDIIMICDYVEFSKMDITQVILKLFTVEWNLIRALQFTLANCTNIKTLKLEYCNLKSEEIETLSGLLEAHLEISELSIDGNPNESQNFHLILECTEAKFVSMRMCKINEEGTRLIANELANPKSKILCLNLCSNQIGDGGCEFIAKALRSNRLLCNLNLADNWITDEGCKKLMAIFRKFPLEHAEIVIRRGIIFKHLLKRREWVKDMIASKQNLQTDAGSKEGSKGSLTLPPIVSQERKFLSRKGSSSSKASLSLNSKKDKKTSSKLSNRLEQLEKEFDLQQGTSKHPFVCDSYPENKEIYCIGNFSLMFLNLAYNSLSEEGIDDIVTTLDYQHIRLKSSKFIEGILHVNLDGNVNMDSEQIQERILRHSPIGSIGSGTRRKFSSIDNISNKSPGKSSYTSQI